MKFFLEYGALSGTRLNHSKSQIILFYGVSPPTLATDVAVVTELRFLDIDFDCRGEMSRLWETANVGLERQVSVEEAFTMSLRDRGYTWLKQFSLANVFTLHTHVANPPLPFRPVGNLLSLSLLLDQGHRTCHKVSASLTYVLRWQGLAVP